MFGPVAASLKSKLYRRMALSSGVQVGSNFHVGPGSRLWAPSRLVVGDDVYVGKWCTIEVDGAIGSGTLIANSVGIVGRRDHALRWAGGAISQGPWVGTDDSLRHGNDVTIGRNVWIGYGVTILSGVTIGDHAVVAAGATVFDSVAPNTIVGSGSVSVLGHRFSEDELGHVGALLISKYGDGL